MAGLWDILAGNYQLGSGLPPNVQQYMQTAPSMTDAGQGGSWGGWPYNFSGSGIEALLQQQLNQNLNMRTDPLQQQLQLSQRLQQYNTPRDEQGTQGDYNLPYGFPPGLMPGYGPQPNWLQALQGLLQMQNFAGAYQ